MSAKERCKGVGHQRLWGWFGLSYASFLTLPRVLMHEIPDEWQSKMADLLYEYDDAFPNRNHLPSARVQATRDRKLVKWPGWLLRYRYPDRDEIEKCVSYPHQGTITHFGVVSNDANRQETATTFKEL
jgi:hypothetical protein